MTVVLMQELFFGMRKRRADRRMRRSTKYPGEPASAARHYYVHSCTFLVGQGLVRDGLAAAISRRAVPFSEHGGFPPSKKPSYRNDMEDWNLCGFGLQP